MNAETLIFSWSLFLSVIFVGLAVKGFKITKDYFFYGYLICVIPVSILICITADFLN